MSARRTAAVSLIVLLAAGVVTSGCASMRRSKLRGVPIEQRPTPPQPSADSATALAKPDTAAARETGPPPRNQPAPAVGEKRPAEPPPDTTAVATAMSPEERRATLGRIVADTTAASGAVRKCYGKELLPDQETVYETTRSLLMQARAAISKDELWRAESLARKARQLGSSLDCR